MNLINLKNKKVLITGGTAGIGLSILESFYKLEADIFTIGTNVENLKTIQSNFPKIKTSIFNLEKHQKIEELLKEAKEWYAEWKSSQGCFKCGDKRSYVLDLHHVDNRREGNKNRLLSRIISSGTLSFENRKKKILDEAKNCVVVCSNCHREIHYFEKN